MDWSNGKSSASASSSTRLCGKSVLFLFPLRGWLFTAVGVCYLRCRTVGHRYIVRPKLNTMLPEREKNCGENEPTKEHDFLCGRTIDATICYSSTEEDDDTILESLIGSYPSFLSDGKPNLIFFSFIFPFFARRCDAPNVIVHKAMTQSSGCPNTSCQTPHVHNITWLSISNRSNSENRTIAFRPGEKLKCSLSANSHPNQKSI